MSKLEKHKIIKENFKGKVKGKKINKLTGFEIKPRNTLSKKDILVVKKVNVVKPSLIEYLLIKKIYLKMEAVVKLIEDNDDPSPSDLKMILDEVEKLRGIVKNQYAKFLTEEKVLDIFSKTNYLLQEVGIKAIEKEDEFLRKNAELETVENKSR